MKPISLRRLAGYILISTLLALAACVTPPAPRPAGAPPAPPPAPAPTLSAAEKAEQAGDYVVAAREYENLSQQAQSPQREHYALKAVDSLVKAGQVREARDKLGAIDVSKLDPSFQARKRILEAQLLSLENKPDESLRLLAQAEKVPNLNPTLIAEIYRVRAQAEMALDHPLSAVKSLIAREKYIVAPADLTKNQEEIWHVLEPLSRDRLEQALKTGPEPVLAGWLELGITALEHAGSQTMLANAVDDWRKAHPAHPATDEFLKTIAKPQIGQIGRIDRIALLLPLSSEYAQAAAAVRDGFLAMQANDRNPAKPTVQVVDIGADPAQAVIAYQKAEQDGAQFIVGPLGVEAAEQVAQKADLKVPTMLLSAISEKIDTSDKTVFQFGLAPEQEATQAAERAYLDGHRQAAVLYPDNAWGRRLESAFVSAWQRLGGIVVSEQSYLLNQQDYTDPVKRLLNITQSEARKDRLESVLKQKLAFESRPRDDIDFVFLAADTRHARLIKPQLNYNHALRLPVYATSYVFTGQGNAGLDIDLDGIQFGDMPWMLVGDGRVAELRKLLQPNWPYAHTGLDRLYALGVDAYAIIPNLNRLSSENAVRFNGVTSGLSLGRGGRLHRQLLWAQFRKGLPMLVDGFFRYKGQFDLDAGSATAAPAAPHSGG